MFRFRTITRLYSMNKQTAALFSNPELLKTDAYVNGKWINSGKTFAVNDPAKDKDNLLADVTDMDQKSFASAIDDAYAAFPKFRSLSGRERGAMLQKIYQLMMDNADDLAKLIVLENGKPYADALGEVKYSASFFQWFAEEAPRVYGSVLPSADSNKRILAVKQPVGVCGIMTPWNFPSAMIARKMGAAMAAGCPVVIRPASETPLSALALAYFAEEAGFPAGAVNVLPSSKSSESGKELTTNPKVKKVSFTGSTRVGKILMEQSSSTLKKLSMELGGNAPFIVFEDADLDKAAAGAMASKFRSSGQTCVCANRLYIHEKVYDEFTKKFIDLVNKTKMGNGMDKNNTHGPVINPKSMEKVREHIDDAVSKGAKVLAGGNKLPDLGSNFHELTVLGDVTADMEITKEETFGPVCPLIKFSTDEEVIAAANDTPVGLAGYFFSKDATRVFRVGEALEVGMVGINTGALSEAALPFGGVGEAGFGREGSKFGIDDYTVVKSMVIGLE
ncbi:aldehyde dehydrogenase 5, mitochondrial [Diutina catenulata]